MATQNQTIIPMKKLIFVCLALMISGLAGAQTLDQSRRMLGLYISPGLGSCFVTGSHTSIDPAFAGSLGYRFVNRLNGGFYIEGGISLGMYRTRSQEKTGYWYEYDPYYYFQMQHQYSYITNSTELSWSAPFLAGYRSTKGKVRFNGGLGIAFNLKILESSKNEYLSGDPSPYTTIVYQGTEPQFGTSFSALARAGISIPIKDWVCIDLLPTLRYRMFYFTKDEMDLGKCIKNSVKPWSLGLDFSFMFAINDKEPDPPYHTEDAKATINDFTNMPADSNTIRQYKSANKSTEPYNMAYIEFAGNGMIYSMNYERRVYQKGGFNLQVRAGMGFTMQKYAFPVGVNIALGKARKKFETGVTFTMNNYNRNEHGRIDNYDKDYNAMNFSIDPNLAFRVETRSHMFFRLSVLSHYFPITGGVSPGVGVSIGGWF
jgi:hypothetical protein